MPRPLVLVTVFVVSFLGFALWQVPASVATARVAELELAGAPVELRQPQGRIWAGAARGRGRPRAGRLEWALDWQGFTPGLALALTGSQLNLEGWLGAGPARVWARSWDIEVPVALIARGVERGSAEGYLTGQLRELDWRDQQIRALQGELRWSGGRVSWRPDGGAEIPPLDGRLYMADETARAEVTDPDGQRLADLRVRDGELNLLVYRAWPMLLGVSSGGQGSDVVFEVSRPLPVPGGADG
jgi:general secretion pathway protein N